jgi:ATP-binding cassette subfamily F protein uup
MAGAPIVVARDIRKAFGPRVLLDGVRLSVHDGERIGLVGINGSGKSTLSRIIAGVDSPDEGEVARRGDAEIAYLAQVPRFEGDPTAHAAVMGGLSAWQRAMDAFERATAALEKGDGDPTELATEQANAVAAVEREGGFSRGHAADAMLAQLGVRDPEQRVSTMSGGEKRRVALARILVSQPTLAILDEPTNHLDADTVEWLEGHLRDDYAGSLLLVTHDRYLLDAVCTRTLEIDQACLFDYEGGWSAYLEAKTERLAHEERTERNRRNFLRRELEWLRRSPKARTTKQKARVERAEQARDATPAAIREEVRGLSLSTEESSKKVLTLESLTVNAPGGEGRRLIDDLSLIVQKGERIGIVGPNGAGKTTLLRTILGDVEPVSGRVVMGKRTTIAYFDQGRADLDESLSVRDNVAPGADVVTIGDRTVPLVAWLDRFLFPADVQRKKLAALSGGERARVALAKLMLSPASLFLFDEPTNDLDVSTLGAVEDMLLEKGATALVVTHDRYFLDKIATSILAFEETGEVVRYAGGYSDYRRARDAAKPKSAEGPKPVADQPAKGKPVDKGLTYGEEIELREIMPKIEVAEAEVARLEAEVADPELYTARRDQVSAVNEALESARAELESLLTRWEQLEGKKSE